MLHLLNRPMKAIPTFTVPLISIVLCGCSTTGTSSTPVPEIDRATMASVGHYPPTSLHAGFTSPIRYGRYTLAATSPRADQVDLLGQIIDIRIPDSTSPSVHEAMAYVLRHSGYHLCPGDEDVQQLYAHPLPASHYRLGPISVRDALITLAGNAWGPEVNEKARSICFAARTKPSLAQAAAPSVVPSSTTAPFTGGDQ
jgi:conjugative transfer region protein (TIGR03748 family)